MAMLHIISDKFKNVANGKNILIYSEAMKKIKLKTIKSTKILIDQGISEEMVLAIKNMIKKNYGESVSVSTYFDKNTRCDTKYTHKDKLHNTLISNPENIFDDQYQSLLMVDDRCAELSDHVTGKHLQFMVLVEAARQMVNAVTEIYYSDRTKIYLANTIDIEFNEFVYPFKTKMIYKVTDFKMKEGGNGKMSAEINFIQSEKIKSTVKFTFTILDRNFVDTIESASLRKEYSDKTEVMAHA